VSSDEGALRDLEERLCGLRLRARHAQPGPTRWEDWTAAPFPVPPAKDSATGALLTSVAVARTNDRLAVTISEPDNTVTFAVADGEWLVSEPRDAQGDVIPVAASGGWLDEHTLMVEVIFLETPHRMDIACSLPARTADVSWRATPLDRGRLQTLHRPR
jgi:hypothetical protein